DEVANDAVRVVINLTRLRRWRGCRSWGCGSWRRLRLGNGHAVQFRGAAPVLIHRQDQRLLDLLDHVIGDQGEHVGSDAKGISRRFREGQLKLEQASWLIDGALVGVDNPPSLVDRALDAVTARV